MDYDKKAQAKNWA